VNGNIVYFVLKNIHAECSAMLIVALSKTPLGECLLSGSTFRPSNGSCGSNFDGQLSGDTMSIIGSKSDVDRRMTQRARIGQ